MEVKAFHRKGQKATGPWGWHTSSMDWCEDNYTHSNYIAEFWNTVSNIPFIFLGIFGILSTRGLPNRPRYIIAQSFLIIIGAGSFAFHCTLLWNPQLMFDELPMVWSGAMFIYLASVGGAPKGSLKLKASLTALPLAISWVYLCYPYPVLFQTAYGITQLVVVGLVTRRFRSLPSRTREQTRARDECQRNFITGSLTFVFAFVIWNIDNIFCEALTSFRTDYPWIPGVLSQGHAWWHILAGVGSSRMVSAVTYISVTLREPGNFEFAYILGHPYVRRRGQDPFFANVMRLA